MSFQTKLRKIADALTSIPSLGSNVYHYWRFGADAPYCIWQEDGDAGFQSDNHKGEQAITGTVDYFTLTEYDGNIEAIQIALNNVENLSWAINSVQYEEDTNLIHYEWRWSLYG